MSCLTRLDLAFLSVVDLPWQLQISWNHYSWWLHRTNWGSCCQRVWWRSVTLNRRHIWNSSCWLSISQLMWTILPPLTHHTQLMDPSLLVSGNSDHESRTLQCPSYLVDKCSCTGNYRHHLNHGKGVGSVNTVDFDGDSYVLPSWFASNLVNELQTLTRTGIISIDQAAYGMLRHIILNPFHDIRVSQTRMGDALRREAFSRISSLLSLYWSIWYQRLTILKPKHMIPRNEKIFQLLLWGCFKLCLRKLSGDWILEVFLLHGPNVYCCRMPVLTHVTMKSSSSQ